jgi:hypothetical protein
MQITENNSIFSHNRLTFSTAVTEHTWLLIILCLAVALRLPGVLHGLPVYVLPSECEIITQAANVLKGRLFPDWIFYGGLCFYVHTLCIGLTHLIHYSAIQLHLMPDTSAPFWIFYAIGRSLNIFFCCILIAATYGIALRSGNRFAASIAALTVSLFPLPHQFSLQITPDMTVTMFAALSIYFSVCYYDESNKKSSQPLYLAALCSGCAIGSKYMFVSVIPFIVAKIIVGRKLHVKVFDSTLIKSFIIVLITFIVVSPHVVITFSNFVSGGLLRIHSVYASEPYHTGLAYSTPVMFIRELFFHDITPGLFIVSLIGLIHLAITKSGLFFIIFPGPLSWFVLMSFYKVDFTYNIMIILVPLATSAGIILAKINHRKLRLVIIAALCIQPFLHDFNHVKLLIKKDIRYVVQEWIGSNLPHGSNIAWEDHRPFFKDTAFTCSFIGFSSLAGISPEALRAAGYNYVISPFYEPLMQKSFKYSTRIENYKNLLQIFPVVKEFDPAGSFSGDLIRIIKIE